MADHTQPQMLWFMAFNERLNDVEAHASSIAYWEGQAAHGPIAKRGEAREYVAALKPKLKIVRAELERWVIQHPYPATALPPAPTIAERRRGRRCRGVS